MAEEKKETLYLVTGAAGFLGGTVCRQLVEQGYYNEETNQYKRSRRGGTIRKG